MQLELSHGEIVGLMRSLLRSLPKTPPDEQHLHSELYAKLSEAHVDTLAPGVVEDVGRALDGLIGR